MLKKMKLGVLTAAILASSVVYAVEPMTDVSKSNLVENSVNNSSVNKESVFKRVDIKATQIKLELSDNALNTSKLFDDIQMELDSGASLEDVVKKYGQIKLYKVNDMSTVFGVRASFKQKDYIPYISDIVIEKNIKGVEKIKKVNGSLEIENQISFTPYLYQDGSIGLEYIFSNEQLLNMDKLEVYEGTFVDGPHTNNNSSHSTIVIKNNKSRLASLSQDASIDNDKNKKQVLSFFFLSVNKD